MSLSYCWPFCWRFVWRLSSRSYRSANTPIAPCRPLSFMVLLPTSFNTWSTVQRTLTAGQQMNLNLESSSREWNCLKSSLLLPMNKPVSRYLSKNLHFSNVRNRFFLFAVNSSAVGCITNQVNQHLEICFSIQVCYCLDLNITVVQTTYSCRKSTGDSECATIDSISDIPAIIQLHAFTSQNFSTSVDQSLIIGTDFSTLKGKMASASCPVPWT